MTERIITTLEELLKMTIDNHLWDLHTALPSVVEKQDVDGTVVVTPAVMRVSPEGVGLKINSISGVPVSYPSSAGFSVTFPVTKGDEGLLIFCERDISRFKSTSSIAKPQIMRKHNYTDAVFIPCGMSKSQQPTPTTLLELTDKVGGASVTLGAGNVNITGVLMINGVPYLGHTHTSAAAGSPTSPVIGA